MKILTSCPEAYVGVSRVFQDGQHLGLWKFVPTDQLSLPLECDLLILGGASPPYHLLLDKVPQAKWLLWTSPPLQTELAGVEMEHLLYYIREPRVSRIWFGDRVSASLFRKKGFYAPYPVAVDRVKPTGPHERDGIGFFVPFHNKNKNIYNQLAAMKLFQETHSDIVLKTGGMSPEQKRFADAVGLNYKDLGWRSGQDYYDDLHSCRMSLHVTLSESFGYSVIDSMLLDTPGLVSPTVSWVPRGLGLVCQDPSDPTAIANAVSELYFTDPPPEVRPTALAVAERRNETLKASMDGWQNRL